MGWNFVPWPDLEAGLRAVTYLKVDLAEAEYLTGLPDYREACQKLVEMGPKEIVLTQSSGVTVYANGRFYQAPFFPRSLAGRTGRGDTCFQLPGCAPFRTNSHCLRMGGVVTTLKTGAAWPLERQRG
jgi:sugar/nucleoside kinase (ribokinase family)